MNKAFKVIWSKTRNCYVVVSELAKKHSKSSKSGIISKTLMTAVLLSIMSGSVMASGVDTGIVTSPDGYAGGTVPIVTGNGSIAIGTHAVASGNNMTWEQLKAMMDQYNIKKENHDDLSTTVAGDVSDVNNAQNAFDAASTAAVAVQAARDAQAGYQSDLDNHNQQKPAIDDAYNTAKDEYETLYNDFQNRLNQIKYIDFSVYADGSAAGYNYNQMASDLKTNTETGTTFDMPVQFYYDYIQNYIKANGDSRLNANRVTNVYYKGTTSWTDGFDSSSGVNIQPKWIQSGTGVTGNYSYYMNSIVVRADDPDTGNSSLKTYYSDNSANRIDTFLNYIKSFDSDFDTNSIKFKTITPASTLTNSNFTSSDYTTNWCGILSSSMNGSTSHAETVLNNLVNNAAYDATQRDIALAKVQNIYDNNLSCMNTVVNKMVSLGQMTSSEGNLFLSLYASGMNEEKDILNAGINVAYYQYMYENTGDIAYIGNKEQQLQIMDEKLKSGNAFAYNANGIGGTLHNFKGVSGSISKVMYDYYQNNNVFVWSPAQAMTRYLYENYTAVQDATIVALRAVTDGLEGVIADKKQAYDDATAAKEANDNAITNLQNQIASLEPTPEQQALADELDQKAQDLQNAQDKLAADEAALQQAYQDMLNAQVGEIGEGAIAIGDSAITTGKNAIGVGSDVIVTGEEAVAFGSGTVVSGKQAVGIGSNNSISKDNAIAIGTNNGITGQNSIAIGNDNIVSGENSIAIGNSLSVSENNVVALGGKKVSGVTDGAVATDAATVGQTYELVAGTGVTIEEDGVNAIGQKKYKLNSTATGGANYNAGSHITIEDGTIDSKNLIAYDSDVNDVATMSGTRGTKLTNLKAATIESGSTDAVIGHQLWQTNKNIEGFAQDINRNKTNITTLNQSVTDALSAVAAISDLVDTMDQLKADSSLNNLTTQGRAIINTAAADAVQAYMAEHGGTTGNENSGHLTAVLRADGDAVTQEDLDAKADISYVDNALAGKADVDDVTSLGSAITDLETSLTGKIDSVKDDVQTNTGNIAALDLRVTNTEDAINSMQDSIEQKADISYVDEGLAGKADKDSVYTKEETDSKLDAKADTDFVNEELDKKTDKDAGNIDVQTWADKLGIGKVAEGNEGLVKGGEVFNAIKDLGGNNMVQSDGQTITIGANDSASRIDISNADGNSRVITGVAVDINDPTSAANVGYVNALNEQANQAINTGISRLDDKINKTGAGAAALANLHPMDTDGDTRWNISAAVGKYHGSTAGALGVFYKPSERVMMNLSSTIGNNDTMFGAGVTVAVDKPMANGMSKVQLVKTVNAQAEKLQQQDAINEALIAEIKQLKAEMAEMKSAKK